MAGPRVLLVVSSAEKGKAVLALHWALRMRERGLAEDVKVYLFGPVEELVANRDPDVYPLVMKLVEAGVEVLACHGYAEMHGFEDRLREALGEERVTHVGRLILERVGEGYTPITF